MDVQEEEARQIALLEEAMRASPSLASALSDQLRGAGDNVSVRSFRGDGGGHEPRRSFSVMDSHAHLVQLAVRAVYLLLLRILSTLSETLRAHRSNCYAVSNVQRSDVQEAQLSARDRATRCVS